MNPPKAGKECMLPLFDVLDKVHALIWKASGYPVTSTCEAIRRAHTCNVKATLKWP